MAFQSLGSLGLAAFQQHRKYDWVFTYVYTPRIQLYTEIRKVVMSIMVLDAGKSIIKEENAGAMNATVSATLLQIP